jgi:hypothetical protein
MSKGSAVRPIQVSNEEYAQRWDMIFRRDLPNEYQMDRNLYEAEITGEPEVPDEAGYQGCIELSNQ